MELIGIYIEESKAINDLLLTVHSGFNIFFDNKVLIVKQAKSPETQYYKGISFSLLLGENGTGKTTILDYIESVLCDSDEMGFSVWFDGENYQIFDFFNLIKDVKGDHPHKKNEVIKKSLAQQDVSALKLSNVFDLNKYVINSSHKSSKNKRIIDLTNNSLLRKSKRNIVNQDLKNEFSYVENIFTNFISSEKDKPEFTFSLKTGNNFSKSIRIAEDYPKTFTGEVDYFNETINDPINYPEYQDAIEWCNKHIEDQYLDFGDILDLIFYRNKKDRYMTNEDILTLIAPSIFKSAIRKIKAPNRLQKTLEKDETPSDQKAEDYSGQAQPDT